MKLKNQNQSLLSLALFLSLILLLSKPIMAGLGPDGREIPDDQLEDIAPEEAVGQIKTELMIPYNPNAQTTLQSHYPASYHRIPVDQANSQPNHPMNDNPSNHNPLPQLIPQPLKNNQNGFDEFNASLSSSENLDRLQTQDQENIYPQSFVRLPPLRPPEEIIETVMPNTDQFDGTLLEEGQPTRTSVNQQNSDPHQNPNKWDSAQKHFQPNSQGGLTQQDSSDFYYDVEKDKTPVPKTQMGLPIDEPYQIRPSDVERPLTSYRPEIPVLEGKAQPLPIPDGFGNQEQNIAGEDASDYGLPTSYIPNPKFETMEQDKTFDDQRMSSPPPAQESTQIQQQQKPPTHKLVSEKNSDQAVLEPRQQPIPSPMSQIQEDERTKTLHITPAPTEVQHGQTTIKPKQMISQTIPIPSTKNDNTNTITINVGQPSQSGQIPNFGGMAPFVYSPFFNPLQFMPSGYPAITWPYPFGMPSQSTAMPNQGGQMMPFSGQNQGLPQQTGSMSNSQLMPQNTSAPISQPTSAPIAQSTGLYGSSALSSASLNAQRTDLIAAIKALRTKLEQASLTTLLGSDIKNFNSRLDEFQTIADLIWSRGYELFTSALLGENETVKTEMTEFVELVTIMVEGGRSASDQDQARPFSLKSYDKDSVTVLNRFSDILGSLIECEGFALTMQHLGLLEKFLKSCKIIMFPPFTPIYSFEPTDAESKIFRASYDKFVGKINAMATALNSSDIREKQSVPEQLLAMLEEIDYSPDLMVIQPFGFKESTTLKLYPVYTKDNFPKDQPSRNKISALLSRDIFRDILATALIKLILTGAEIFVDKFEASTLFKSIPEVLRLMFVAAIENIYQVKVASMVENTANGQTKRSMRHTVLDKLDEELERSLSTKQTSPAFRKLVVNSGTSWRDFKILRDLISAEALLRISGPGEVAYEATTPLARILSDYKAGTAILSKIFLTYNDPLTFSIFDSNGIEIKQVSDSTINRLYLAIEDANEDSRTVLGSANSKYTAMRAQLMICVGTNGAFKTRLAKTNREYSSKLNGFISRQ